MCLRTDYGPFYRRSGGQSPPADQWPRLYSATKAEALHAPGTAVYTLFHTQMPRFWFSPPEQELLFRSLFGGTDEELADGLGVALVTVKKRWKSIYARAETVMPIPFSEALTVDKRGGEKKRRLLDYLRYNLQELRPVERRLLPSSARNGEG